MAIRYYLGPMIQFDHPVHPGARYVGSVAEKLVLDGGFLPGTQPSIRNIHKVRGDGSAHPVCLTEVDATDFSLFDGDSRLSALPSRARDANFTGPERTQVSNALDGRGITASPRTINEVINSVSAHLETDSRSMVFQAR